MCSNSVTLPCRRGQIGENGPAGLIAIRESLEWERVNMPYKTDDAAF